MLILTSPPPPAYSRLHLSNTIPYINASKRTQVHWYQIFHCHIKTLRGVFPYLFLGCPVFTVDTGQVAEPIRNLSQRGRLPGIDAFVMS